MSAAASVEIESEILEIRGRLEALTVAGLAAVITAVTALPLYVVGSARRSAARAQRMEAAEDLIRTTDAAQVDRTLDSDDVLAVRYRLARDRVEEEVRNDLPANPRTAKRMINHLSLALAIAEARGVLREGSEITIRQLAKWIGLVEQWPPLGAALTASPEPMVDLENAAGLTQLQGVLDTFAPGVVASDDLRRRLREGEELGMIEEPRPIRTLRVGFTGRVAASPSGRHRYLAAPAPPASRFRPPAAMRSGRTSGSRWG